MREKLLGEIAARLAEAAASNPARDFEKNAKAVLAAGFAKLDLVTREEFDVQSEVLARARIRVAELEAKVAALEARLTSNNEGSAWLPPPASGQGVRLPLAVVLNRVPTGVRHWRIAAIGV